jgi:8-oxo-dGTP diphosphatase
MSEADIPTPTLAKFVAFHDVAEADQSRPGGLYFSIILARAPGGVVLVFNRWRKVWELPGGLIDPGESPADAAVRELWEEAGCVAVSPEWRGVIEVSDGRSHFGAVYECRVADMPTDFASDETGAIAPWQRGRPPPQPLGNSDAAVLNRWG